VDSPRTISKFRGLLTNLGVNMKKFSKIDVGVNDNNIMSAVDAMDVVGIKKTAFFKYRQRAGIKPKTGSGGRVWYTQQEVDAIRNAYETEKGQDSRNDYSADSSRTGNDVSADSADDTDKARRAENKDIFKSSGSSGEMEGVLERELRQRIIELKEAITKQDKKIESLDQKIEEKNKILTITAQELGRWEGRAKTFEEELRLLQGPNQATGNPEDIIYADRKNWSSDGQKDMRYRKSMDAKIVEAETVPSESKGSAWEDVEVVEQKSAQKTTSKNEKAKKRGKRKKGKGRKNK
jgi:hypothetical protein